MLDAGGLTYLETDHLGSPRAAINPATNAPVWRWHLAGSAFGESPPNEQPGGSAPFKLNLRFPGQYFDAESGMHYNYFRDYEPGTGRYVESDPIGLQGGLNLYAYASGNSISRLDRLGLSDTCGKCANEDCLLYGGNVCGNGPQGALPPTSPSTVIEVGVRPFDPVRLPLVRHCFLRFNGNASDTLSFDNQGTHGDPSPFTGTLSPVRASTGDISCVKRAFEECNDYHFTDNNCCDCAADSLQACGIQWPSGLDPNPIVEPGTERR